jgi:hypothetical protein
MWHAVPVAPLPGSDGMLRHAGSGVGQSNEPAAYAVPDECPGDARGSGAFAAASAAGATNYPSIGTLSAHVWERPHA